MTTPASSWWFLGAALRGWPGWVALGLVLAQWGMALRLLRAALTPDRPDLQPGFEDADTSVQACVPIYGTYDPANHLGHQLPGLGAFLARFVLEADPDEDPALWDTASPNAQVRPDAPPFLVVHGDRDSVTSPQEARAFTANLRATSHAPAGLAMLPGAQHAFDLFPSIRTAHLVLGVARFLAVVHHRTAARSATPGPAGRDG